MDIQKLKTLLSDPKKIVITSHKNPDGDALGSSLAMWHYLKEMGHSISVIMPTDFPDYFNWLKGAEHILTPFNGIKIFDKEIDNVEVIKERFEEAEIIFCLDFNSLDRIDEMGEHTKASNAVKVLIDHHLDPEDFADYALSDTSASSTCELVYDFILSLDDRKELKPPLTDCLLTGIFTDTGSFSYSTSPKLFQTVGDLLELGVNYSYVQDKVFNSQNEKRLRLLGHCLTKSMFVFDEYNTGLIVLTQQDYQRFNIKRGDTEGIVNYILKMAKIRFAVLITDQKHTIKLSLRSKGDFSVQEFAQSHFSGGGHRNASGGISNLTMSGTVIKFKKLLPQYKDKLTADY